MDLDTAIKHAEEVAEECYWKAKPNRKFPCFENEEKRLECEKCAEDHEQLAIWLKEYKQLLDFAKWVTTEILDDNWEDNIGAFAEIACRKLNKFGLVKADGNMWVKTERN